MVGIVHSIMQSDDSHGGEAYPSALGPHGTHTLEIPRRCPVDLDQSKVIVYLMR